MIYKNALLHNIAELVPYEDQYLALRGIKCEDPEGKKGNLMCRIPNAARLASNDVAKCTAFDGSNTEIRFNINSGLALVKLYTPCHAGLSTLVEVYFGNFQGYFQFVTSTGKVETIGIQVPDQVKEWAEIAKKQGLEFDPSLVRVILPYNAATILVDIEGDISLPRPEQMPKLKYLSYGSSISHGLQSSIATNTYVYRIARALKADVYNKGFGGSCCMDPAIADYIAEQDFDFMTMELGINVLGWSEEEFYNKISYFTERVINAHPDRYFFITDIFTFFGDYRNEPKADIFREIVAKKAAEFASDKVVYIPAKHILKGPDSLCVDMLHPSNKGMQEIADAFIPIMKKTMGL